MADRHCVQDRRDVGHAADAVRVHAERRRSGTQALCNAPDDRVGDHCHGAGEASDQLVDADVVEKTQRAAFSRDFELRTELIGLLGSESLAEPAVRPSRHPLVEPRRGWSRCR